MLTELQKKTAQAIVNIFETSRPSGDYGRVSLINGDTGHLTYGRSQTTLGSGNLYLLIKRYCETSEAQFGAPLGQYLKRLSDRDISLDMDLPLRTLLREAGGDPVMRNAQDAFFDQIYWIPSQNDSAAMFISSALGATVVYDSKVHGSWALVRDITCTNHGKPPAIVEREWIGFYVSERRNWLATHSNAALHPTVYRMDAFAQLIDGQKWDLPLPITVCGVRIDPDVLMAGPTVVVSAHDPAERNLQLQTPFMAGGDVAAVQRALVQAGFVVDVDGIYGNLTEAGVRRFQQQKGLRVDGIVGPATRAALGL